MSAHTPGPWKRIATTIFADMHDSWWRGVERVRNRFTVGVQFDASVEPEEREATLSLIAAAPELLAALKACRDAEGMPTTGDHSGFVWPERPMRWPGDPSGGWVCPKHGLGYWQPCGCCADDYARHCAARDHEARTRRDDALYAARKATSAAIAKAEGKP